MSNGTIYSWRKAIDPSIADRFWSHVAGFLPGQCWLWKGYRKTKRKKKGYGGFSYLGRVIYAHHVALALDGRPVKPGQITRHTCDQPACCNPAHLTVGTHADNTRDKVLRGRTTSPICEATARDILVAKGSCRALAKKFGVSKTTINNIKLGKTWAHLRLNS